MNNISLEQLQPFFKIVDLLNSINNENRTDIVFFENLNCFFNKSKF